MHSFQGELCTYHTAVVSSRALAMWRVLCACRNSNIYIFFSLVEEGAGNCYSVCWLVMCYIAIAHCTVQALKPRNNRNNMTRFTLAKLQWCLPNISPWPRMQDKKGFWSMAGRRPYTTKHHLLMRWNTGARGSIFTSSKYGYLIMCSTLYWHNESTRSC